MQFFSTILLIHTLREIIAELEQHSDLDTSSPALVQLKHTLQQQLAILAESRQSSGRAVRFLGAA
jgi:hypothetical protein